MAYSSIELGKRELLEQVCQKYMKLMGSMQNIEAQMSDLKDLMNKLDLDVTTFIREANAKESVF